MRKALMAVLLFLSGAAFGQAADVGLVNMVLGEVAFAPHAGVLGKVSAYMRVRDGDQFEIPAGAQLRVVYFEGARQERWQGPASFRAAKAGGQASSGAVAEVIQLPAVVPQRIARVPELVHTAKLGGIQVRGMTQPPASSEALIPVSEARAAYEQMTKQLPADDITPELFLYSALNEHRLYDDMKPVVSEMRRKQPASEDVKSLESWLRSRTGQ
jgi:hypothetical protein